MSQWTFGRKIALGFAVSALALIFVAALSYRNTTQLIDNAEWVAHTYKVRRMIADLMATVVNAETGQRGFVITGDRAFLEPHAAALPEIKRLYTELRGETRDNAQQQARLDRLKPMLDRRIEEFQGFIDKRAALGLEAAVAEIATGRGKQTMDELRALVAEIDDSEEALLASRTRAVADSTRFAQSAIGWGAAGALLVIVIAGVMITAALNRQIGAATQQMQSSSAELQAAANQQASSSTEQATAMSEIATTISELLATSRQISESAQRVSAVAAQTAQAARSGDATVVRGNDASATVRRQVDQIVTHMLELGERSQQMGVVLDMVSELAEQTNILAINATIEAAGAGEAGRRFGVVADEIRKLADRVAASTKEIRSLVDGVRGAVNTTVMATEAGSKAVDAGAAQVAEMATAFRQIASLVVTTTESAREIELSTKQQTTAVEQVNVAISSVAQAARETEAGASQTLQASSQIAGLSGDLLRIVKRVG